MATNKPRTLEAVERTLELVDALVEEDSLGVTELSERTGLPTSTVYVHLQTLRENDYVVKEGSKYRLSLQFLHYGGKIRERLPVYRHGRKVVHDLAKETGELVNLAIEENGRGVVIFMARGDNAAVDLAPVGKHSYLHRPAFGRAILSCFSDDEVNDIVDKWGLRAVTENTVRTREALFEELDATRERGYAIERDEGDVGISCVGAPIQDIEGNPVGAISVTVPSNKLRDDRVEEELSHKILNGTNIIELKIEHA
ncbi:IclR family transcriptional regulator [Haloferax chudinovii]|uniref:IclR family transcriptional regulator n=1 Tax=Haloferax chudinovii TaxID=1109010 RepID=A0ABD5XNG2_9EURY